MKKLWRVIKHTAWWQRLLALGVISFLVFSITSGVFANLFGGSGGAIQNSAVNLDKGLAAWWKLDGNVKDSTPQSRDLSVYSGAPALTSDREGQTNSAYSFNGTTDAFRSAGFSDLGTSNQPYSFAGWFKPNAGVTSGNIVFMSSVAGGSGWCLPPVAMSGGKLQATSWTGSNVTATGATTVTTNQWHQFAMTWDATNGLRIYLDGALDGSTAQASYSASGASNYVFLTFGGTGCTGDTGRFAGALDDVRTYARSLSSAEVSALYKEYGAGTQVSTAQQSLVGWWNLDGNAKDSSPYGDNGTVYGSTVSADREGQAGKAYCFNGTASDYIDFGDPTISNPGSSNFSISLWFKANATGSLDGSILYNKESLFEASAGGGYFTYAWNPHWAWDGGTSFPINTGQWYHAVVVYDGVNQYLYENGSQVYSRAQTGSIGSNTNRLALATRGTSGGGSSPFSGCIDDFRIYDRALSSTDIANMYNSYEARTTGSSLMSGQAGYWPFNGNAKDNTPYGNNGSVNGATLATDREGNANSAYSFNGSAGTDINFGNTTGFQMNNGTVSAWVNASSPGSSYRGIVVKQLAFGMFLEDGVFVIYDWSASTPRSTGVNLADGKWHHVVCTFQSGVTNGTVLYIDGQSQLTTTMTINGQGSNLVVGSGTPDGSVQNLAGSVDEVRVWNRVLTATEVKQLYDETR